MHYLRATVDKRVWQEMKMPRLLDALCWNERQVAGEKSEEESEEEEEDTWRGKNGKG